MLSDTMMLGGGRKAAYSIENSLLFRGGQYLSRTPGAAGNRKVWTWSAWYRIADLAADQYLFTAGSPAMGGALTGVAYYGSYTQGGFALWWNSASTGAFPAPRFRDPSGFYHLVLVADGTKLALYINGNYLGEKAISGDAEINNLIPHYIGMASDADRYVKGSLSEVFFIDGEALPPTKFGEFDPLTGSWRPKSVQNVTFGPNGFYLGKPWSVTGSVNDLGTDYSGKGNHWTPTGFLANDVLKDSPTNVYATLNPLSPHNTGLTLSAGNLAVTTGGSSAGAVSNYSSLATMPFPTTGKYAYRAMITSRSTTGVAVGLAKSDFTPTGTSLAGSSSVYVYEDTGKRYSAGAGAAFGSTVSVGQAIDIAFDATSGNAWVGIYNGSTTTWQGSGDPVAGINPTFTGLTGQWFWPWVEATAASALAKITVDFGQRGYVPPSGFKPLCTANLPTPVSAAAKQPGKYYSCQLVIHNGTSSTFTLGWNPDPANGGSHTLFRIKGLAAGLSWNWIDTVRGIDKVLFSDSTEKELTGQTQRLSSISSSGMCTLGSSFAAGTYLVEAWRVAPEAGFDIVTYTGTGVARTISHRNNRIPGCMVIKNRDTVSEWPLYHGALAAGYDLRLNNTEGQTKSFDYFNSTAPTSSGFTVGVSSYVNGGDNRLIAYVWSEVPGFSAFGKWVGTASIDGPYAHLGFVPATLLAKASDQNYPWNVWSSAIDPTNTASAKVTLCPNSSVGNSTYPCVIDFLAAGTKLRSTSSTADVAGSGYNEIYAAWAAHPLGAKRVTPATAR